MTTARALLGGPGGRFPGGREHTESAIPDDQRPAGSPSRTTTNPRPNADEKVDEATGAIARLMRS